LISLAGRTFVRLKKLAMGIPNAIGAPAWRARGRLNPGSPPLAAPHALYAKAAGASSGRVEPLFVNGLA
jgi:hypothetical protein